MDVKFEKLHFGYTRKREILHGIDLTLPANKFIAILGPNGCGKTTMVKQINQILRAQTGTVRVGDQVVSQLEPSQLAKMIAYVPQMTSGVMNGSVMDTVMLGRRPYIQWKPTDADVEIVANALIRLNISHLSQRLFNQLSGGQKQTVLIARARAQAPDIYLFDEPVSFLDVRNQLEIMAIGRELVEQDGKTVIMVLHDLNMALRFADHVVIMKDGNVFAQGSPRDVITEENILAVYGTHAQIRNGEYVITSLYTGSPGAKTPGGFVRLRRDVCETGSKRSHKEIRGADCPGPCGSNH